MSGAAPSRYWIDFNLYLASLGLSRATIGLVVTVSAIAGALGAFPASAASDRVGRRLVIAAGLAAALAAMMGLLASEALPVIVLAASLYAAGTQAMHVVVSPYLTEHSEPDHRNELFAAQFAIGSVTNIVAAVLGGVLAGLIAASLGLDPSGSGTYRVILVIMAVLSAAGLATVTLLSDDRPGTVAPRRLRKAGEPASFPYDQPPVADRDPEPRPRSSRFARLLLRGLLILHRRGTGDPVPQPGSSRAGSASTSRRSTPCSRCARRPEPHPEAIGVAWPGGR